MIVVDDVGEIESNDIRLVNEYYLGDSANPNCIATSVIKIE